MNFVLKAVLGLVLVALLAICAAGYWVYSSVDTPHQHARSDEYIKIEKGSTPREIVSKLVSEGILAAELPTLIYLRTGGDGSKLQAGEYQFPSPISPLQVLKQLEKGQDLTIKLVIPEGFTRFDIAKRLAQKVEYQAAVDPVGESPEAWHTRVALEMMDDTSLIKDIAPEAKNLEGYLYPSTYTLSPKTDKRDAIRMMVEQFRKVWKPEWTQTAKSMGRTPHQIVTIASLIETETSVASERPIVAGVINNRLAKNIPLGIDQTNVYIAKMMGRWDGTINRSDLDVESPYNTRIKTGIPPGPISSVSESSIIAALNPTPSDYIFYVRNVDANDGSHWFYSSAAEFEKGKAKYQSWLEKERQGMRMNTNTELR